MNDSIKPKYKALIVDDDKDLLEMLSEILISGGLKVVTAVDGVDAVFKYNNEKFDIILSDIKMPKKDGIKFIQHIQEVESQKMSNINNAFKPTPIMLISASAEEYSMELEVLGNIQILNKPFSPRDVLDKVNRLLGNKVNNVDHSTNMLSFKAGDYVMKEGEIGTDVFFVKEGTLEVFKKDNNGSEISITTIKAGEMVGEMSLLFNKNRTASVIAMTECLILSIPKEKFESVISTLPKWFKVFFETTVSRIEDTTRLLAEERSKK